MKSSIDEYRTNAEDCMRMAELEDDNDRPLWVTLAQSWLRLAEQVDRIQSGGADADNKEFEDPLAPTHN